ncbi:hypothetical protein BU16DRAFT_463425, partial [Lophium mytilinum]
IVFVHGLTGNRRSTWTYRPGVSGEECFWPRDILPKDIPEARIMTWGYDADVLGKGFFQTVSGNNSHQHAKGLCADLERFLIAPNGTILRPIVFVCHSLGGLSCKEALMHSQDAQRFNQISASTCGILFMGTPHRGAPSAGMAGILVNLASTVKDGNPKILDDLKEQGIHLEDIRKRFELYLAYREQQTSDSIQVACCYEEKKYALLNKKIVPDTSAILDRYPTIGILADHSGMTKYEGRNDNNYQKVLHELKKWVKDSAVKPRTESSSVTHQGHNKEGATAFYGSQSFSGKTNIGKDYLKH